MRSAILPGAALVAALGGCVSYSYVDDQNVHHVIGLVDIAIKPARTSPTEATAIAVAVTSVGLAVYARPENTGGVVLGYSRQTLLMVPNNACVDLNAAGPCSGPPPQTAISSPTETAAGRDAP